MSPNAIHIVVPDLLDTPRAAQLAGIPRLKTLEALLAKADREPAGTGVEPVLFDLFGLDCPNEVDLPTAALSYLADTGSVPRNAMVQAIPVLLRPDQDRLLLFDFPPNEISTDQADELVALFNRHFAQDGLRMQAPTPGCWYLHLKKSPELTTSPLSDAIGRNIDPFLPQGADARQWRGYLNEVQMLFHECPANLARQENGRMPVSGIWLSGLGELPSEPPIRKFAEIEGDLPLLRGLQEWADRSGAGDADDKLIVLDAVRQAVIHGDEPGWLEALRQLDAVLAEQVGGGREVRLYDCAGQVYQFRPGHRRRWWRRVKPLSETLSAN